MTYFKGKTLLITSSEDYLENALLQYFLQNGIGEIRILFHDEKRINKTDSDFLKMNQDFKSKIKFFSGDLRNSADVSSAICGVDYIIHCAALNNALNFDFSPIEAVRFNVEGTDNLLYHAIRENVKKVVCLSSDKAAYPIDAWGTSIAMMEHIINANVRASAELGGTPICCVRLADILCRRKNIIPHVIDQIREKKPVTVLHPECSCFFQTPEEAVDLICFAFENIYPGDMLIKKTPACTVGDLVIAIQKIFGDMNEQTISTHYEAETYETLLTAEERRKALDMWDHFCVPVENLDLNYDYYSVKGDDFSGVYEAYTSKNAERLNVDQIIEKLLTTDYIKGKMKEKRED